MKVGDLTHAALADALQHGLRLKTGPVVTQITTDLGAIAPLLALHYAEHSIEDANGFADFHVRIARAHGIRRWYRPQVLFYFDDAPPFHPLPLAQAFPMLEWGLNWCVSNLCHQYITIHAAVVERNGKALVLPAPPGSGKSTLCAGLIHRGWRLLSDELALIDPSTLSITPLPRPVSLKNASIEVIRHFAPEAVLSPPIHDTIKGSVAHLRPPASAVTLAQQTARPGWLVLPQYAAAAETELQPLSRARALMALIENSFNFDLHGERGFRALADWIDAGSACTLRYSKLDEAAAVLTRMADTP